MDHPDSFELPGSFEEFKPSESEPMSYLKSPISFEEFRPKLSEIQAMTEPMLYFDWKYENNNDDEFLLLI